MSYDFQTECENIFQIFLEPHIQIAYSIDILMVRSTLLFFAVRGAKNEVSTKFTKLVIFDTKMLWHSDLQADTENATLSVFRFDMKINLWEFSADLVEQWRERDFF